MKQGRNSLHTMHTLHTIQNGEKGQNPWNSEGFSRFLRFSGVLHTINTIEFPKNYAPETGTSWVQLEKLKDGVVYGGIQFNENLMYVFGQKSGYNTYRQLEAYNLKTETSELYEFAFSENKISVGSFITDSKLSIFGGGSSLILQESADLDRVWQFQEVNSTISVKTLGSYIQFCQFSRINKDGWALENVFKNTSFISSSTTQAPNR